MRSFVLAAKGFLSKPRTVEAADRSTRKERAALGGPGINHSLFKRMRSLKPMVNHPSWFDWVLGRPRALIWFVIIAGWPSACSSKMQRGKAESARKCEEGVF